MFLLLNWSIYVGKFNGFYRKIWRFLWKNLTVFTGTLGDLDFPVKNVTFSCTNWQIFFKKLLTSQELRFIQENLMVFIWKGEDFCMIFKGTSDDLHFPVKTVKFSCTNSEFLSCNDTSNTYHCFRIAKVLVLICVQVHTRV